MSKEETFNQLIQFRSAFKRLMQVGWSIKTSEDRFFMGNSENERNLLAIYKAMVIDAEEAVKGLVALKKSLPSTTDNKAQGEEGLP